MKMPNPKKTFPVLSLLMAVQTGFCAGHWIKPSVHSAADLENGKSSTATTDERRTVNNLNDQQDWQPGERIRPDVEKKPLKRSYLFEEENRDPEEKTDEKAKEAEREDRKKKEESDRREMRRNPKKYAVTYSGNQFIREKKKVDGREEIFLSIRGNARIRHHSSLITAPVIEVTGEDGRLSSAPQGITITDEEEGTTLRAGYGEYVKLERRARVRLSPVAEYRSKKTGKKTVLKSDEMERFLAEKRTVCYGNVVITSEEYVIYGEKAVYLEQEDIAIMTGPARIFQQDNIYIADKVTLHSGSNRVEMKGNVHLILTEKTIAKKTDARDTPEAEQAGAVITTVVRSDSAVRESGDEKGNGARTLFEKGETGRVSVSREDSYTLADRMETRGTDNDFMQARGGVRIHYRKDGTRIFTELAEHDRAAGTVVLKTVKAAGREIKPQVYFYNKDRKATGALSAVLVERNLLTQVTQARGDVDISMYDDQKQVPLETEFPESRQFVTQSSIRGEWAEIFQEKRMAIIHGNPYLKRGASRMYGRKIILYPDTRRFEILGGIHGSFEP